MYSNGAYFLVNGKKVLYTDGKNEREIQAEVKKEVDSMICKPHMTWDDLGALKGVKNVMDGIIDSLSEPQIPGDTGDETILLFGANGVGKTCIASAIAHAANATFFVASSAHLLSCVQGRSTSIMEGLFKKAREEPCAVILFDFVDMMFSEEGEMLDAFLDQMKLGSKTVSKKIIVIACTDMPSKVSQNVLKNFKNRFYITRPNQYACGKIFEQKLKHYWHILDKKDYKDFAAQIFRRSSLINGFHISHVVQNAEIHQYGEPEDAEDFCRVTDKFPNAPDEAIGKLIPWKVEYGEECRIGKTYKEIRADKELLGDLTEGPLDKNDIINAIWEQCLHPGHDEMTYVNFMRANGGIKLDYDNVIEIEEKSEEKKNKKKKSIWSKVFGF